MALQGEELFHRTMETMGNLDALLVMGGTIAAAGEESDIQVGLGVIIPVMQFITGDFERHQERPNPFVSPEEPLTLPMTRLDKRFARDHDGPDIGCAAAGGIILGRTVDIWMVGYKEFYLLSRSAEQQ